MQCDAIHSTSMSSYIFIYICTHSDRDACMRCSRQALIGLFYYFILDLAIGPTLLRLFKAHPSDWSIYEKSIKMTIAQGNRKERRETSRDTREFIKTNILVILYGRLENEMDDNIVLDHVHGTVLLLCGRAHRCPSRRPQPAPGLLCTRVWSRENKAPALLFLNSNAL